MSQTLVSWCLSSVTASVSFAVCIFFTSGLSTSLSMKLHIYLNERMSTIRHRFPNTRIGQRGIYSFVIIRLRVNNVESSNVGRC